MPVEINPTLILGLGGQGCSIINRIKGRMVDKYFENTLSFPLIEYLAIDSEFEKFRNDEASKYRIYLTYDEQLALEVNAEEITEYIKHPENLDCYKDEESCFIDRRVADIIDVGGYGCSGWPIICRTNAIVKLPSLISKLSTVLQKLNSRDLLQKELQEKGLSERYSIPTDMVIQVYIFTSLGGGTGRGLYEVIVPLLRAIFQKLQPIDADRRLKIRLFNVMPSVMKNLEKGEVPNYVYPNTYTAFRELEHFMNSKNNYEFDEIYKCRLQNLEFINLTDNKVPFTDHVYLLFANDTNGYLKFRDYDSFKLFIAEYISDAILMGFMDTLLAKETNISSQLSGNQIVEIETGRADRQRRYGRIAFYKIKYPTEYISKYISLYLASLLLEDLRQGFIDKKEYPNIINEINEIILQYGTSYGTQKLRNPTLGFNSIEDDWISSLEEINPTLEYANLSQNAILNTVNYVLNEMFNNYLLPLIKSNGLLEIKTILDDIFRNIKSNIKGILSDLGYQYNDSIFKNFNKILNDIGSTIDNEVRNFENIKDATIKDIQEILDEERDKIPWYRKLISNYDISSSTKNKLNEKISNLIKKAEEVQIAISKYKSLIYFHILYKELENQIETVEYNIEEILELKRNYEKKAEEWINKEPSGYIKKMFFYNKEEAKSFFEYINSEKSLLNRYDREISNQDWIRRLLRDKLDSFVERIKQTLDIYMSSVENEVKDFLNKRDLIKDFLEFSLRNTKNEYEKELIISNIVNDWLFYGNFLGPLRDSASGGEQGLSEYTNYVILFPKETDFDNPYIKTLRDSLKSTVSSRAGSISISENILEDIKDEVTIIGLQHSIPLFLFDEVHEAKEYYMKIKNEIEKIARHNNKSYVWFDEPIGRGLYIRNEEDLKYFLNLAYQLRAIKGNINSFNEFLQIFSLEGNKASYKSTNMLASQYEELLDKTYLIKEIEKAIINVYVYYLYVFLKHKKKLPNKLRKEIDESLRKFLSDKYSDEGYLPIPKEIIFQLKSPESLKNIFPIDDDRKVALNFIKKFEKDYNAQTIAGIKNKFGKNIYSTEEDLKNVGLFVMPDPAEISKIISEKGKEVSERLYFSIIYENKDGKKKLIPPKKIKDENEFFEKIKEILFEREIPVENIYIFRGEEKDYQNLLEAIEEKNMNKVLQLFKPLKDKEDILKRIEELQTESKELEFDLEIEE